MLPKSMRLSQLEILHLRHGRRIGTSHFELTYQRTGLPSSRWVVFVPKKLFPKATVRNRLKRLCYEVLRQVKLSQSYDGRIKIMKEMKDFFETQKLLEELFNKAEIYLILPEFVEGLP